MNILKLPILIYSISILINSALAQSHISTCAENYRDNYFNKKQVECSCAAAPTPLYFNSIPLDDGAVEEWYKKTWEHRITTSSTKNDNNKHERNDTPDIFGKPIMQCNDNHLLGNPYISNVDVCKHCNGH